MTALASAAGPCAKYLPVKVCCARHAWVAAHAANAASTSAADLAKYAPVGTEEHIIPGRQPVSGAVLCFYR
jgi:hypothetical protein